MDEDKVILEEKVKLLRGQSVRRKYENYDGRCTGEKDSEPSVRGAPGQYIPIFWHESQRSWARSGDLREGVGNNAWK